MKLTKAEKELILKKRKEEELNTPKKMGFLREDLYIHDTGSMHHSLDFEIGWGEQSYFTQDSIIELVSRFQNGFKKVLPKGHKFICYINEDGEELWSDYDEGYIEEVDDEWAEANLENIQKFKE